MSESKATFSFGLLELVFLVFLVLKLTGHLTWSWWWITAPLWGQVALALVFIIIGVVIAALTGRKLTIKRKF